VQWLNPGEFVDYYISEIYGLSPDGHYEIERIKNKQKTTPESLPTQLNCEPWGSYLAAHQSTTQFLPKTLFHIDEVCRIRNLVARPELNGKSARVISPLNSQGRYAVLLSDQPTKVNVKPENLLGEVIVVASMDESILLSQPLPIYLDSLDQQISRKVNHSNLASELKRKKPIFF